MTTPLRMLIAHSGAASFIQEVALALHEGGMLERFATTIVDRPDAAWRKRLASLPGIGPQLDRELSRRRVPEWLEQRTVSFPGPELVRALVSRMDRGGRIAHRVWELSEPAFDRWVARTQLHDVDGIYGFEHASVVAMQQARRQGLFVVLDLPAPAQEHWAAVLQRELERWPQLAGQRGTEMIADAKKRAADVREQMLHADCVIANSRFTLSTYERYGYPVSHASVVPLAAAPVARDERPARGTDDPLRLLFAGSLGIRKGGHVLLEAFAQHRRSSCGARSELAVCGHVELPKPLLLARNDGVTFHGHLPSAQLKQVYARADVLVLPTLADGFGLVVTEALAHGLPVITTEACGASDLITPGRNGWITRAGEVESLTEALAHCAEHRDELHAMRVHALATAHEHSWERYRSNLRATLEQAMRTRS